MVAAVVNTRGINVALSVLITLEPYLDFFSASFYSNSFSTGIDKFEGAFTLGWVIRTSINVFSFFPYRPVSTISNLAPSAVMVPFGCISVQVGSSDGSV